MSILNVNQLQPVGGGNTITVGGSNIDYSGSITGNISVDGNLTVTGVVSNEDVTNIDSVGVVTARAGINISGGNLQVGGTTVINSGRALYNLEQIKLSDTKEIVLGSSDDLKIYHSGSHSFISEEGAGALKIKGDDIRFETVAGTEFVNTTSGGQITVGGAVFNYQGTSKPYNNNAGTLWGTANIALTGQWSSINWPSDHSDPEPSQPWYMMGRPHGSTDKWTLGIRPGSSNSIYDIIECDNDSNGYISNLKFHTSNGQERLRIDSSGNLGVGVNNPSSRLDVVGGGIACSGWSNSNSGASGGMELGWDGNQTVLQSIDRNGGGGFQPIFLSGSEIKSSANIRFTTSGNGIDFSATGNGSGSMGSELLDDYEEGTWTPTVLSTGSIGSPQYNCTYTKIGRLVTLNADIHALTNTTSSSNIEIGGIPYIAGSSAGGEWCTVCMGERYSSSLIVAFIQNDSGWKIKFRTGVGVSNYATLTHAAINDNGTDNNLRFTLTYEVV